MSTAAKSEVLNLLDMAGYQEGSVVSRQITKAEAGNVTLFAFDVDQGL
ncbi:MAG: cupin domain-containing protein, partial [Chloroflexi bacterium]|nr:cupin domain-containing protein [Chloroflexota bacterium]